MKCEICGAKMTEVDISYDMDYSRISYMCPIDHTGRLSPEQERNLHENTDADWNYDAKYGMWANHEWVLKAFGYTEIKPAEHGGFEATK